MVEPVVVKKHGRRWLGRCPYCDTSSVFSVNGEEDLYYCFDCGKGGELLSFIPDPVDTKRALVMVR